MRETGYYWVNMLTGYLEVPNEWISCYWNSVEKDWRWFGNVISEQQEGYEFIEINETRIKNPDEK